MPVIDDDAAFHKVARELHLPVDPALISFAEDGGCVVATSPRDRRQGVELAGGLVWRDGDALLLVPFVRIPGSDTDFEVFRRVVLDACEARGLIDGDLWIDLADGYATVVGRSPDAPLPGAFALAAVGARRLVEVAVWLTGRDLGPYAPEEVAAELGCQPALTGWKRTDEP